MQLTPAISGSNPLQRVFTTSKPNTTMSPVLSQEQTEERDASRITKIQLDHQNIHDKLIRLIQLETQNIK